MATMTEARPFASLSSGLLARKGAAKPAMRPAAFGSFGASLDDLGWNDMGDQPHPEPVEAEHVPSSIAALTPAPRAASPEAPAVREQQRAIADTLGAEEETAFEPGPRAEPAEVVSIPRRRPMAARDKAAFTLRLDPERHFRLRLACAVTGRSAQVIVTEALDDILKTYPEIDALAGQLPVKAGARS
jgi:hypothetical protein